MYKVLSLGEFASFIADNITTSISFDFYDRWDTDKDPDGPVGIDAYNCKAELVNGVVHIVANAYGGGAPYCHCANRTFYGPARSIFIRDFVKYLKSVTKSDTIVLNAQALPVNYESEGEGDVYMRPIEFVRLVWDCIEREKFYTFAKHPNGRDFYRIKLVDVAGSQMMICNDTKGTCLWWCEISDDTLDNKMNEFATFLNKAGFTNVYLRK